MKYLKTTTTTTTKKNQTKKKDMKTQIIMLIKSKVILVFDSLFIILSNLHDRNTQKVQI